VTTHYR